MIGDPPLSIVLEAGLRRCRTTCRETLEAYGEGDGEPAKEFAQTLLTVLAAIEVALESDPPRRGRAVAAVAQVAGAAAQRLRGYGLDEPILRCAAACDEVAHRCADALADLG